MAESANGTTVTAYGAITDATGALWGLLPSASDGCQAYWNGAAAGFTAHVAKLVYSNHQVYHTNADGGWWVWQTNAWVAASDPGSGSGGTPPPDGGGGGPTPPTYAATLANPSGGDDTARINATLASVKSGVVHAPGGHTWQHNNIITVPAGVTLQGDGDTSVFNATANTLNPNQAIVLSGAGAGLASVKLTTAFATGQGLKPGNSDGSGKRSSQPNSHLVYVSKNASSFTLSHVHGIGGAAGGIYSAGASGGLIDGCTIEYALADGIGLYEGTSNTTVQNCTVSGCGDDGIAIVPYDNTGRGTGIVIQGNNVSGGYWGRGITDVGHDGAVIRNNTVSNYYASGIMADHDIGAGTTAPTNGTIDNNTVTNCPNRASGYSGAYFIFRDATNYKVTNNKTGTIPSGCTACVVDKSSQVTQSGNSWGAATMAYEGSADDLPQPDEDWDDDDPEYQEPEKEA